MPIILCKEEVEAERTIVQNLRYRAGWKPGWATWDLVKEGGMERGKRKGRRRKGKKKRKKRRKEGRTDLYFGFLMKTLCKITCYHIAWLMLSFFVWNSTLGVLRKEAVSTQAHGDLHPWMRSSHCCSPLERQIICIYWEPIWSQVPWRSPKTPFWLNNIFQAE